MAMKIKGDTEGDRKRIGRRQLIQAIGVGGAGIVASRWSKPIVDAVVLPLHAQASAVTGALYAISGAGGAASVLYILDPATGAVLSTIGPTGFNHVTAMDFHPFTGVLYGVTSEEEGGVTTSELITIDLFTGAGSVIGATGLGQVPDMSFDPSGTLYAWTENGDDLATINIGTGTGTVIGSPIGTSATGLAFSSSGTLYLKPGSTLHTLNPADGTSLGSVSTGALKNALAFSPGGTLYSLARTGDSGPMTLYTINPVTGAASSVGSNALSAISALAFNPFMV